MVPDHYLEVLEGLVDWPVLRALIADPDRRRAPHFVESALIEHLYGERPTPKQIEELSDALAYLSRQGIVADQGGSVWAYLDWSLAESFVADWRRLRRLAAGPAPLGPRSRISPLAERLGRAGA